jgi:hypothetical protein
VEKKQLTLGELIERLKECQPDREVKFDFANFHPGGLDSYRGFYEQLAIEYQTDLEIKTADFIAKLEKAVGRNYEGYKGGSYTMFRDTPVWVANYGESTYTGVVGVLDAGYITVIETAFMNI